MSDSVPLPALTSEPLPEMPPANRPLVVRAGCERALPSRIVPLPESDHTDWLKPLRSDGADPAATSRALPLPKALAEPARNVPAVIVVGPA